MHDAKAVTDVAVGERRELRSKRATLRLLLRGFTRLEAEVFQQHDAARLDRIDRGRCGWPNGVRREDDVPVEQFAEPCRDRGERVALVRRRRWPTQVRA